MNPPCARCDKIVYPTEKVSCLDKTWHKACFHCEVCKMTLNMKNYKGYSKKPYCSAHYPKQTFTTIADTPENLRLKQQSELQSQVKYKEDFEKSRGKGFSIVPDTPELRRIKKAQEQISHSKYQEEPDKGKQKGWSGGGFAVVGERAKAGQPNATDGYSHSLPRRAVEPDSGDWRRTRLEQQQQQLVGGHGQREVHEPARSAVVSGYSGGGDRRMEAAQTHTGFPYYGGGTPPGYYHPNGAGYQQAAIDHQQRLVGTASHAGQPTVPIPVHLHGPGRSYRALYDYTAADDDEVSFTDGDLIVNVQAIDEGWMYGTVQRTGHSGMLPANYVEAV
uniref:LIM and SH3 domain protein 1-like isoform X2 n=1 Tax=Myxine glutinosa TaxID=7769 RepID=UPI00358FD38D